MKLSEKSNKKIVAFSEAYDVIKKASEDVSKDIEEVKKLVKEGSDNVISNFSQESSTITSKFSESVGGLKNKVSEVVAAASGVEEAIKEEPSDPEIASFSRKARILKKTFSEIEVKFNQVNEAVATALEAKEAGTNVKESVVPASPERVESADNTKTTTKVSVNPPSEGVTTTEKVEVANFSKLAFYKFSLNSVIDSFEQFSAALAEANDIVEEITMSMSNPTQDTVVEVPNKPVDDNQEAAAQAPNEETAAAQAETPAPEVKEGTEGAEATAQTPAEGTVDYAAEGQKLVEAGIKALEEGNKEAAEDIAAKADELEKNAPGEGEKVIVAMENFAKELKAKKNFSVDDSKAKLVHLAKQAITTRNFSQMQEVCKLTEELDTLAPGAGEEVTAAVEQFSAKLPPPPAEIPIENCPKCGKLPCECELVKSQEELVKQGIQAFAANDKEAMQKVAEKAQELENTHKGAGEEVTSTIENFSELYKLGFGTTKNFGTQNFGVFGAIKELVCFAADKILANEEVDTNLLTSKCEDLEKSAEGAGDLVVSVVENFCNIKDYVTKKMTPETAEDVLAQFCESIEKFVGEIPVVDKNFAHQLKKSCYEVLTFCDQGDRAKVIQFCKELAPTLTSDQIKDEVVKNFGKSLSDFCGRLSNFDKRDDQPSDEIAKADNDLNECIDKLGEKGAQLEPKCATFAKKLCDSYKSMRCFTEEQLATKVKLVEGLKSDLTEQPQAATTENTETVEQPAQETQVEQPKEDTPPADGGAQQATEQVQTQEAQPGQEEAQEQTQTEEPLVSDRGVNAALLAIEGDKDYDPEGKKLTEETPVSEENRPSDQVVLASSELVNFSAVAAKETSSYDDILKSL